MSTQESPDGAGATASDRPPQDIFISYRRSDAGWAASALHDGLAEHFGASHVFIDVLDLLPGVSLARSSDGESGPARCSSP